MTNLFGFIVGCVVGWFVRKYYRKVGDFVRAKKLLKSKRIPKF